MTVVDEGTAPRDQEAGLLDPVVHPAGSVRVAVPVQVRPVSPPVLLLSIVADNVNGCDTFIVLSTAPLGAVMTKLLAWIPIFTLSVNVVYA